MSLDRQTLDRIIELGAKTAAPFFDPLLEYPTIVVPDGFKLESLEKFCLPVRIKRNVQMLQAESFCDYVNRFKTDDSLIFCNITPSVATMTAILDYHGPTQPHCCSHNCSLVLTPTPDWTTWVANNGKQMSQIQFASFLEDHSYLFNSVKDGALKGAELLELVSTLHGKKDVRFNSSVRLNNGSNRLDYVEDVSVQGATKAGSIDMPSIINAGMSVFDGGPAFQVDARLKTRVEGRAIMIWYETIAMHKIIRDSIMETVKLVAEKTQITPLIGASGS